MFIVKDSSSLRRYSDALRVFERELYVPCFPDPDEREPFDNILSRIADDGADPKTFAVLETVGDELVGGGIADYRRTLGSLLLTYVAVKPEWRSRGIGRMLLETRVRVFPDVRHVFLECDDPATVTVSGMDPAQRLAMFRRWGFSEVPIRYWQPPLGDGQGTCGSLLLLHRGEPLTAEYLRSYLTGFYTTLGCGDAEELRRMLEEIG